MTWRELYNLVTTRRLRQKHRGAGTSKEMLLHMLKLADEEGNNEPGDGSASGQGASSSNRLAKLLDPTKKDGDDWFGKKDDNAKETEDITGMFMDVTKSGHEKKAAAQIDEIRDSVDGVLPSVAVDKFLQATRVLATKDPLGVLFGHEKSFGKGSGLFKRNVITTLVCGWPKDLTMEPRLCMFYVFFF